MQCNAIIIFVCCTVMKTEKLIEENPRLHA
jgi:hypothetical protein